MAERLNTAEPKQTPQAGPGLRATTSLSSVMAPV